GNGGAAALDPCARRERSLAALVAVACAIVVTAARVYLLYHSTEQVVVGAALGVALGVGWHALVQQVLGHRLVAALVDSRVGRMLRLRDASGLGDVLQIEYETISAARERALAARRRQAKAARD